MNLDEPVIVLTGARSGSTLVRLLLNAHPDLACPPETNIVKIASQLSLAWRICDKNAPEGKLTAEAAASVRNAVNSMFAMHLIRHGKSRWCDKSLGSVEAAKQFLMLYPKAKFICLYRHCMDFIDSALESSPWGLAGYGFEQFNGMHNGNMVAALASYWIEASGRILEFEQDHPDCTLRVRYEALVSKPDAVINTIFSFVGLDEVPDIVSRCFASNRDPESMYADHKIWMTDRISSDSVGRGIRIPMAKIPPAQLQVVNHILGSLEYTQVDSGWNQQVALPVLVRTDQQALGKAEAVEAPHSDATLQLVCEKLKVRLSLALQKALPNRSERLVGPSANVGIIAYSTLGNHEAKCISMNLHDMKITAGSSPDKAAAHNDWCVTASAGAWTTILDGQINFAVAARNRLVRYVAPANGNRVPSDLGRMVVDRRIHWIGALLGVPSAPEEIVLDKKGRSMPEAIFKEDV
jgi:hypothetical protein